MADFINSTATMTQDYPTYAITARMFELAERNLALGQFAQDYALESYMGKTMRIVRARRFSLPTTPLIEGVPPDGVPLQFDNVDIRLDQWGIVSLMTDVSRLTLTHPVLELSMARSALAIAELMEREIAKTLLTSGTNVIYGNAAATSRAGILNTGTPKTDRLQTSTILNATVMLRGLGAPPYDGDLYGAAIQPQQEGDLLSSDTTFQNASNFARVRKLENAEIGIWQGVQFVRTNFAPIFAGVAAPDASAVTLTKAQATVSNTGGSLAAGNYQVVVVARDANTDYERRVSQNSANLTVTGSTGSITVTTPTAVSYTYDVYVTQVGGTVPYLAASRLAANTAVTITTVPTTSAPIALTAPTTGTEVFVGWVFGTDAFARVRLDGMSMVSYVTPDGPSYSDPLAQGRKQGTKLMFKCAIQDQNFLVRLETVSGYPSYLPTT